MQKFTQKYTIIMLLEDRPNGYEFSSSNWPLHVTIADTFAVDWDSNNLRDKLSLLVSNHVPVTAIAAHDEYFGSERQTQVTILDTSKGLIELHNKVIALLEEAGAVFNNPEYNNAGFRAHATVQPHARLNEHDAVSLNNLTVIDMFPNKNPHLRKIIKIMELGKRQS